METTGVIPIIAPHDDAALRPARTCALGVPLLLWAVNNLGRVLRPEHIAVVTDDEEAAELAGSRGIRVIGADVDLDVQRVVMMDAAACFCSAATLKRAISDGSHEAAAHQLGPIERLRVESVEDLELVRAVAAGLAPTHPCVAGVRWWRLGLSMTRGPIEAVISDVDGVLTRGLIAISSGGETVRSFHAHDGMGVHELVRHGVKVGWLSSGMSDGSIHARADYLGVDAVDVGAGEKGARLLAMCNKLGTPPDRTMYIGDDLNDLPAIELAGVSACPADARPEIRAIVDLVLETRGGCGCFREAACLILDRPTIAPVDEARA